MDKFAEFGAPETERYKKGGKQISPFRNPKKELLPSTTCGFPSSPGIVKAGLSPRERAEVITIPQHC